jgi:transglutaminase-like putative cysteine protease
MMKVIIREAKKLDPIRREAIALTAHLQGKDWRGEIFALFDFVQNEIRYQRDITGVETLTAPLQTLSQRAGDCDDKVMLLAAMLEAIGHPTRIFAMGFKRGVLSHVILETKFRHRPLCVGGDPDWLPLDPTEPQGPGWLPPAIQQRMYLVNR